MTPTAREAANVTGLAGVLDPQKSRSILRDSVQWGGYIQRFGKHGPTVSTPFPMQMIAIQIRILII